MIHNNWTTERERERDRRVKEYKETEKKRIKISRNQIQWQTWSNPHQRDHLSSVYPRQNSNIIHFKTHLIPRRFYYHSTGVWCVTDAFMFLYSLNLYYIYINSTKDKKMCRLQGKNGLSLKKLLNCFNHCIVYDSRLSSSFSS